MDCSVTAAQTATLHCKVFQRQPKFVEASAVPTSHFSSQGANIREWHPSGFLHLPCDVRMTEPEDSLLFSCQTTLSRGGTSPPPSWIEAGVVSSQTASWNRRRWLQRLPRPHHSDDETAKFDIVQDFATQRAIPSPPSRLIDGRV